MAVDERGKNRSPVDHASTVDSADKIEETKKAEEILEKYDSGSAFRKNIPFYWKWVIGGGASILSLFHLYTAIFGTLPSNQQRGFHLAIALGLVFLLFPANKKNEGLAEESSHTFWDGFIARMKTVPVSSWVLFGILLLCTGYAYWNELVRPTTVLVMAALLVLFQVAKLYGRRYQGIPFPDVILAILGLGVGLYHFFEYQGIIARVGIYNDLDFMVAGAAVLLVLEAARRVVGMPIVVVAALLLLYAHLGAYIPGYFSHRGFSVERIISHSFLSLEGILGIPISISATFIYLFIMFGVILQKTGLEKFFTNLALSLTGWMTGGTAKVGVLTSLFSGTITGSSVANTVSNGAFTIPMMKRSGYKPEFAAGVESASSTGGQIMPPIMGSAAFLMIEFTGLAYSEIIKAALIPALLFFMGQFIYVHYESKRLGIMGVPRSELPNLKDLLLRKGYLLLPIVAIIVILSMGQSAMKAALYGIYTALAMSVLALILAWILGKRDQLDHPFSFSMLWDILVTSARTALPVIIACAAAGIIVGVITLTGLGLRIAGGILELAMNQLLLTLFFTMIASIVLGMGLPTTANYVITATMAAPALLAFDNVPLVAAHLFVFYFGIVADITPPVALAAYAGSGLANSNPFKTSIQAVKIAIGAFLIPYMFVLSPQLLLGEAPLYLVAFSVTTATLGMFCIATALVGYIEKPLHWSERLLLTLAGLSLVYAHLVTDILGVAIFLAIYVHQKMSGRKGKKDQGTDVPPVGV
ncbi:TRAP transporter permease [Heliorestis convoluta]|uniref:TRAP transporter, 4TM/12TM fusion family protein n=1 Tax=Heliorestis convoluta TaxID=356322 RepID=A0A5Q2MZI5_9FIRM|nr:TRAP transporter permease [Heliorestis convoluta]QGG46616.1 TRAP transporter, 4TM/12TM fusion family protein [Heliorestis convoluta]